MAESTSGVRWVRCPKCRKVLAEVTHIPVYQCGGCGTTLRAKNYSANRGNSTTESPKTSISLQKKESLGTDFRDAPSRSSSDDELAKETPPNMREVDNTEKEAITDIQISSPRLADDRHGRQIDSLDSSTRRSQNYDNDLSSSDPGGDTRSSDEIMLVKDEHFSMSVDKMTAEGKNELPDDNLPTNPSKILVRRDTSLDSVDFHSVQNQFGLEKDTSLRHLPMDAAFDEDSLDHQNESTSAQLRTIENVQLQILQKVDELRDDIGGLFHIPVQVKERSQLGGVDEQNYSNRFRSKLIRTYLKANQTSSASPGLYEQESAEIREIRKPIKHHCRPVLGGAPFVICHNCLKLLQLPLNFVIRRKRVYRLKCGHCSKVLTFSFRSRKQEIPLTPDSDLLTDVQHPPSEASASRLADRHKEDRAIDVEKLLHDPGTSADPLEERNAEFRKSSKLHRLMGYDSASKILFQRSDSSSTSASEIIFVRDAYKGKAVHISSGSDGGNSPDSS